MNDLEFVNKYKEAIFDSGYADRFFIDHKDVGTTLTDTEASALAKEALWLTAKESPKAHVATILRKAKKLYSRWLREDYLSIFAQIAFKQRHHKIADFEPIVYPIDRAELESEVYNCLDFALRNLGVHLGLWAILSFALQDTQSKSQTIYKYMGLNYNNQQRKNASLIIKKLQKLIGTFKPI